MQFGMGYHNQPAFPGQKPGLLDLANQFTVQPAHGRPPQHVVCTCFRGIERPANKLHQAGQFAASHAEGDRGERIPRDHEGERPRIAHEILDERLVGREPRRYVAPPHGFR